MTSFESVATVLGLLLIGGALLSGIAAIQHAAMGPNLLVLDF